MRGPVRYATEKLGLEEKLRAVEDGDVTESICLHIIASEEVPHLPVQEARVEDY